MSVKVTPFHVRAAERNRDNAWMVRNGTTIACHYGHADDEAIAAHASLIMADISTRSLVVLEGAAAGECLSRVMTRDPSGLAPGSGLKALWLNDRGALRGAGLVARETEHRFVVASASDDIGWFADAAKLFGVAMIRPDGMDGAIALIGPQVANVLAALGLPHDLELLAFERVLWRGLNVVVSRWGEHDGYEIWCAESDALILWDRIVRAGTGFALKVAGSEALDTLDLEAGVARPERDYVPARSVDAVGPCPTGLGLNRLIDPDHTKFNGRAGYLVSDARETMARVSLMLDSECPAPNARLISGGRSVGRTMSSRYSPLLRCAVALAQVERPFAPEGTVLSLDLPFDVGERDSRTVKATVVSLPLAKSPNSIG